MAMQGQVSPSGTLHINVSRAKGPGWEWKLRNTLRWSFLWGWTCNNAARLFSRITGIPTIIGQLSIRVRRANGEWIDYGVVGYRVVTNAGVAFLVDDWDDNTTDLTTLNFHGCGTGSTAENVADTALVTESTTVLDPDSTRATGTKSQPSANVLQSVGTLTFDGAAAVVEHGLFSQEATGGGTLWDRTVFSAINVGSGDSIQFTYQASLPAGS